MFPLELGKVTLLQLIPLSSIKVPAMSAGMSLQLIHLSPISAVQRSCNLRAASGTVYLVTSLPQFNPCSCFKRRHLWAESDREAEITVLALG